MAKSLNIVIGANIDKLRDGMNQAVMVIQSSGKKMSADVAESAKSITDRLSSISTKNPTMGTVRQLTQLAMETRALGPEFANMANQIIKEAGHIKDSIADTRGEVAYFASDTRRLDAVLGGIQGVAGAFGAVQGAAALFGNENKQLQATMVKLQAAMAVTTGLQSLQNMLQQESAAVQGVLALRTTVLTVAQGAYATATGGAIGAQRLLNLTMAAAPWALAITAITAIVVSIATYEDKTKKLTAQQKNLNDIQESTNKNFDEEIKNVSGLLAVVNNHNASMVERKKALAEIQNIYPSFLSNQNLDKLNSEELKTATQGLTAQILNQAKAKAAYNKLQELSAKLLEIEIGRQQAQISTQAELNNLYSKGATPSQIQGFLQSQKSLGEIADKNAKDLQNQIDAIIKMASAENLAIVSTNNITKATKEEAEAFRKLEDSVLNLKNTGKSLLAPVDPIVPQSMDDVLHKLDEIPPALEGTKTPPLFTDVVQEAPQIVATTVEISDAFKQMADRNSKSFQKNASAMYADSVRTKEWADKKQHALDALNQAFAQLQMATAENFSQFIADMVTGEEKAGKNFGRNMIGAIANFMDVVGKAMVATAIASQKFEELLLANPAAAAVAGLALITGAAIVKNELKKGPEYTAFAEGGIVSGPTLGLMGEYPGARSNPEVIAPLDKLKSLIGSNGANGGFVASTHISGRDLAIVLNRYNQDTKRG